MMISPHLIEWHCDCGRKYQAGNDDAVIKQLQQQVEALTKKTTEIDLAMHIASVDHDDEWVLVPKWWLIGLEQATTKQEGE